MSPPEKSELIAELSPSGTQDESIESLLEQVRQLEERLAKLEGQSKPLAERATLFVHSGDMDRLMGAFVIATGAVAMGMEVSMFFTFWGLSAVTKKRIYSGKSLSERMVTAMLPSGPTTLGTSSMNLLGMGPRFFNHLMQKRGVQTLPELIELARELGVRMVGCQMSMDIMGVTRDELIDGLEFGGVATYLGDAADSRVTLFV